MTDHPQHVAGVWATNALASAWWVVDQVARHGPSWAVVPPLAIAVASLIGTLNSYRNGEIDRREKRLRLRLDEARLRSLEQPSTRS